MRKPDLACSNFCRNTEVRGGRDRIWTQIQLPLASVTGLICSINFVVVSLLSRVWQPCNPMDVVCQARGVPQARMLGKVAISFSRVSSQPRGRTHVSCISKQVLYHWATREALQHWLGWCIGGRLAKHWASLVAQLVKNLLATQETWVRSLGWEDPLEKGKTTHSSILAWRVPWTVCGVASPPCQGHAIAEVWSFSATNGSTTCGSPLTVISMGKHSWPMWGNTAQLCKIVSDGFHFDFLEMVIQQEQTNVCQFSNK